MPLIPADRGEAPQARRDSPLAPRVNWPPGDLPGFQEFSAVVRRLPPPVSQQEPKKGGIISRQGLGSQSDITPLRDQETPMSNSPPPRLPQSHRE
ncbi:hypothetical protein FRACA_2660005 [Frankia canadensis]|uniref:Uncharacterized protein n=1 Tax=Frankia canadensis TaxID=1836972 RepID=A0A2I2KSK6_9ACTN|nr:hypothetical protein FRACA_2660005 [Frankia canadensis]SOU55944.1 hypothetical protein FRACA_2660005 [Frankia canadensis]